MGDRGMADCARILELFRRGAAEDVRNMVRSRKQGGKKDYPGLQAADLLAGGVYQHEQVRVEFTEISRDANLGEIRNERRSATVVRLEITPKTLAELRDHMFSQMDARRAYYNQKRVG